MTRFERKNRTDIKYQLRGPLFDLVDSFIKEIWRINDSEYDFICDKISDDDIRLFLLMDNKLSISDLKSIIKKVNDILDIKVNLLSINRDIKIDQIINKF